MACYRVDPDFLQRSVTQLVHGHILHLVEHLESINYPIREWKYIRLSTKTNFPNTVYFISSIDCLEYVMKNCDWFRLAPELAIDTIPLVECCTEFRNSVYKYLYLYWFTLRFSWNSSLNSLFQMLLPPLPVPVGSPVWVMKPLMFRWNMQLL